jgi:hypothetical protein
MTNLISLSEGVWTPKDRVFPTEEQKKILYSNNSGDTLAKKEILALLSSENTSKPEDVAIAVSTYNSKKPVLTNSGDTYQFIAASVNIDYLTGTTTTTTTTELSGTTETTTTTELSGTTETTTTTELLVNYTVTGFINYKYNNVVNKITF